MKNFTEEAVLEVKGDNIVNLGVLRVNSNAADAVVGLALNQYKHPIDSTVRELISNALDANKSSNPILVELGVGLDDSPYFKVQDFGEGMNPTQWKEHYMCLMNSSRNDDAEANGGWGIGRLTPLNFVDNYRVITCSENIKYTYLVNKSNNKINFTLQEQEETEDPSGTTVLIKVDYLKTENLHQSILKYCYFFKNIYYEVSPLLEEHCDVKINVINKEKSDLEYKTFKVIQSPMFSAKSRYLLLGDVLYPFNIPYSHSGDRLLEYISGYNILFKFPINSLKPLGSREGINWEQSDVNIFKEIEEEFLGECEHIREEIINTNFNNYSDISKSFYFGDATMNLLEVKKPIIRDILEVNYKNKTYFFKTDLFKTLKNITAFIKPKIVEHSIYDREFKKGIKAEFLKVLNSIVNGNKIISLTCKNYQLSEEDKLTYSTYYKINKIEDFDLYVNEFISFLKDLDLFYSIDSSYIPFLENVILDFIKEIPIINKGIKPKKPVTKKIVVKNTNQVIRAFDNYGYMRNSFNYIDTQSILNRKLFNKIIYFTYNDKEGINDVKNLYSLNRTLRNAVLYAGQVAIINKDLISTIRNDVNFITWDEFLTDTSANTKFINLLKCIYIKDVIISGNNLLINLDCFHFPKVDNELNQKQFDRFIPLKELYLEYKKEMYSVDKNYNHYLYLLTDDFKNEVKEFKEFIINNPLLIASISEYETTIRNKNYFELIKKYYEQ